MVRLNVNIRSHRGSSTEEKNEEREIFIRGVFAVVAAAPAESSDQNTNQQLQQAQTTISVSYQE